MILHKKKSIKYRDATYFWLNVFNLRSVFLRSVSGDVGHLLRSPFTFHNCLVGIFCPVCYGTVLLSPTPPALHRSPHISSALFFYFLMGFWVGVAQADFARRSCWPHIYIYILHTFCIYCQSYDCWVDFGSKLTTDITRHAWTAPLEDY